MNILGDIYIAQNKHMEAYEMHIPALEMYKETWGEYHHRTADIYYKVACHEYHRGKSTDAM